MFLRSGDIDIITNIRPLARAIDRNRVPALVNALTRVLASYIARALIPNFTPALAPAFTPALARALILAIDRSMDRVLGHDLVLARERTIERIRFLASKLASRLALSLDYLTDNKISDDVTSEKYNNALKKMESILQGGHNEFVKRLAVLLEDVLYIVISDTDKELIIANRKYASHIFEYIYIVLDEVKCSVAQLWWKQVLWKLVLWTRLLGIKGKSTYEDQQQIALSLFLWNQLTLARIEGKLPAWEGIRLVREHVT
ncbi:MAG: hypothetical protein SFH39_05060 [Candidatus Magnetobacterium sp. LHC-1]|nr:hypothetical protein [Nitrospirota bacterium]